MTPEILTSNRSELAEGPLWHSDERLLYWVDIVSGTLYSFDPATSLTKSRSLGGEIGAFTIQENGHLLLFRDRGAIELLKESEREIIRYEIPDERETRFNDVAADPEGRVFGGTLPTKDRKGRLYRVDRDRSLRIVLDDVGLPNGIGWSADMKTMYFTDTAEKTIFAFDYDRSTGGIGGRRSFFKVETGGVPDGMTTDAEGCVWTAVWGGSCVLRIDPQGKEMQRIPMPAPNVSCPTFGGDDLRDLYVTIAGGNEPSAPEGAGELVRVKGAGQGAPECRSGIGL